MQDCAEAGEELMASRSARARSWLPRLPRGNEFDIVYDDDCKDRFHAKMGEVPE